MLSKLLILEYELREEGKKDIRAGKASSEKNKLKKISSVKK